MAAEQQEVLIPEVDEPDSHFTTEKVYVLVIYTGGTIGMKESSEGRLLLCWSNVFNCS